MASLDHDEASQLVAEFDGVRGARPWPRDELASAAQGVGALALAAESWLDPLDVNPLVHTDDGLVAVDALAVVGPARDRHKAAVRLAR